MCEGFKRLAFAALGEITWLIAVPKKIDFPLVLSAATRDSAQHATVDSKGHCNYSDKTPQYFSEPLPSFRDPDLPSMHPEGSALSS